MDKKGQVFQNLQALIAPLVAIAIILVVGFLIMSESKTQVLEIQSSDWCVLDTQSRNYTPFTLNTDGGGAVCFNSSTCNNSFVLNYTSGSCCNASGDDVVHPDCEAAVNVTATLTSGSDEANTSGAKRTHAWNGTTTTQEAISDIPAWLPIIVITVIGAILIGLVALFGIVTRR